MADQNQEGPKEEPTIPPWASGESLRHVEKDVLIPKLVREKARERCKDLVDEFEKCCKGRSISMVWHCRKQNTAMKDCLTKNYQDKELFEACRVEYLQKRRQYQSDYAGGGEKAAMKKKESVLMS